jgi:transposase
MYPVKVKTVEQQDLQAMHRIRDEIKSHRIAKANQIRGLVTEYGLVAPQQLHALRKAIPDWLEDAENGLSFLFRQLLQGLWGDLYALDQRMTELDKQIAVIAQEDPTARRLQQLRGVGPLMVVKSGCSGSVNVVMRIYAVYWFTVPVLRCARPKIKMTD